MTDTMWNRFLAGGVSDRQVRPRRGLALLVPLAALVLIIPVSVKSQEADKPPTAVKPVAADKATPAKVEDDYTTKLFVTNPDGSDPKPLAAIPEYTSQGSPEYSRDGKMICFDTWKTGGSVATGKIAVVNADGSHPRIVGDGVMPSFSPKGKRIAFCRSGNASGIWIMSTEGPETELVQVDPQGWGVNWAPDGRLAYTLGTQGGTNLVIVDILEGTREFLFDEQKSPYRSIYWNFAWSPDSKRIVFKGLTTDGKAELAVVDTRGEQFGFERFPLIADSHESLCWSADGSRVLIAKPCLERENLNQIYSFDPSKKDPPQLLPKQDPKRPHTTAASAPDGKKLVISCQKPPAVPVTAPKK